MFIQYFYHLFNTLSMDYSHQYKSTVLNKAVKSLDGLLSPAELKELIGKDSTIASSNVKLWRFRRFGLVFWRWDAVRVLKRLYNAKNMIEVAIDIIEGAYPDLKHTSQSK